MGKTGKRKKANVDLFVIFSMTGGGKMNRKEYQKGEKKGRGEAC